MKTYLEVFIFSKLLHMAREDLRKRELKLVENSYKRRYCKGLVKRAVQLSVKYCSLGVGIEISIFFLNF